MAGHIANKDIKTDIAKDEIAEDEEDDIKKDDKESVTWIDVGSACHLSPMTAEYCGFR